MGGLFKFDNPKPASTAIPAGGLEFQQGNPVMTDSEFIEFRDFIYAKSGIFFTESKKYLLEGRVGKRIGMLKLPNFEEYIDLLRSQRGRSELPALYEAITINETYFFRAEQQFDSLEKILIPEIIKARQVEGMTQTIRLWSSAASTGEEAYTMAIIVHERLKPLFPNVRFQIIATDINNAVIESARAGVYKEYSVKNMPPLLLQKYFKKEGGDFILSDEIKRQVTFVNMNLFDASAMNSMQGFDVVFCCNVLIYFDLHSKQQVIAKLYDSIVKGGYLFVGYSESLHGISKAFKLVHLPKAMVYKRE